MSEPGSVLAYLRDPRLSAPATGALPAWLWSADARRILWANAVGAAIFDAANSTALSDKTFDADDAAAAQIARLGASLAHGAPPRMERLRGFGAGFGRALTCVCSRIGLRDGDSAILVVAAEPVGPKLTLPQRVQRLFEGSPEALAAFGADGTLLYAGPAMQPLIGAATTAATLGAQMLAEQALNAGRASGETPIGPASFERIGSNGATVLVATFSAPQRSDQQQETAAIAAQPDCEADEAALPPFNQPDAQEPLPITAQAVADADLDAAEVAELAPEVAELAPEETGNHPREVASTDLLAATSSAASLSATSAETVKPEPAAERRLPLRFVWQTDAGSHFTIDSGEFIEAAGPSTAAVLCQPWDRIAAALELDSAGAIARALATRDTWSGLAVDWPIDGERFAVELSGLPVFDRDRTFGGYRGFGICRDVVRLSALLQARRAMPHEAAPSESESHAAPPVKSETAESDAAAPDAKENAPSHSAEPAGQPVSTQRPALSVVPPAVNVVPFRSATPADSKPSEIKPSDFKSQDVRPPVLSPVERNAFGELARRLSARLHGDGDASDTATELLEDIASLERSGAEAAPAQAPVNTALADERPVLDRLPIGVLVYRLDRLLYANRAFLDWTGYVSVNELTGAGGLDALFVEHADESREGSGQGESGQGESRQGESGQQHALAITTNRGDKVPVEGRLFTVPWEGESALMLMLSGSAVTPIERRKNTEQAQRDNEAEIRELRAVLETATDGVVVFDQEGRVISLNRGAEALFGYQSEHLTGSDFPRMLAPESERMARDDLDQLNGGITSLREGREVAGRVRGGGLVPLFMTLGTIPGEKPSARDSGERRYFAVFRDVTRAKQAEEELVSARRQAERASSAKSDFLAKISHEIRTPLNAIIGFSEVMIGERFGPIGNERYGEYLKDIHASGGHVVALLNDLLDLSKIEAGKLDLNFAAVNLNELTAQCVALMQPQANRDRIIIRTSLSQLLPPVVADARSVRQIVLNLLSNSIKFTGAGGQVIVSTALTDRGDVTLRVRDTGVGMSEKDIQIALEPFRQLATSTRWGSSGTGLGLPLTKALAEANRASFAIQSAVNTGTLVEVVFPGTRMAAE